MDLNSLEPIKLTLEQFIDNPSGNRGNMAMNLKMVQDQLDIRYAKLINSVKTFKYQIYDIDEKTILVYVHLPSEKYKMTYDVLIQIDKSEEQIMKNTFKVYSNSPSFVFTYAYVFNVENLLISFLKSKYDKNIFKKRPVQRNFYGMISYEKSIYFSILYILKKYQNISELEKKAKKFNKKSILEEVKTPQYKIDQFNRLRKKESAENKTLAGKMKKALIKDAKKREKLYGNSKVITGASHNIKGKQKVTGKSKITGLKHRKKIK